MKVAVFSFQTLLCLAAAVLLPQHTIADGAGIRRSLQVSGGSIVLDSTLEFGFWPEATPREATTEEIDGLMGRTSEWYSQHLKTAFPTLNSFEAVYACQEFDADAEFPLSLHFNASAYFYGPTLPEPIPSVDEMFQAMDNLNFQEYITDFVWTETSTGGLFEEVQRVAYDARLGNNYNAACNVDVDSDPVDEVVDTTIENDVGSDASATCADLLRMYSESNGQIPTTVHIDCLQSPLCDNAGIPAVAERNGQGPPGVEIGGGVACNYTELTTTSEWSDDQTTNSESSEELGTLLTFPSTTVDQWASSSASPMLLIGDVTNHTGVSWGIANGCGDDNHVYLMHTKTDSGVGEEGEYTVIGYQELDAFVGGDYLEGVAGIRTDISCSESPCVSGRSFIVELLGSCRLSAGVPSGDSGNNPGNDGAPTGNSSGGDVSLALSTSHVFAFWLVLSSALMMAMGA